MAALSFIPSPGYGESIKQKKAPEELIKAAYLYKFLFFITWPETLPPSTDDSHDVIIGILGKDPFGEHFKEVEGRIVNSMNKKVKIKRYGDYSDNLNLRECHIIFICASEKKELAHIMEKLNGLPILTVVDSQTLFEKGIMINLTNREGRVRWELNLKKAKESGLKLSSTLIQSAVRIIPANQGSEK